MYLREMGSVELLSREGEIAIAKRIEAGRDMMIGGICESPLTFKALIAWRDALNDGRMLLRDIIDLEATQGGAPARQAGAPTAPCRAGRAADAASGRCPSRGRARGAAADGDGADGAEADAEGGEDDDENALSLSALEEKLKPEVLAHLRGDRRSIPRCTRCSTAGWRP